MHTQTLLAALCPNHSAWQVTRALWIATTAADLPTDGSGR
jgi:hypothetical protein